MNGPWQALYPTIRKVMMREARFAALLGFIFLAACGGGGGGGDGRGTPPTTPPTGSNSVTLSGYAQKGPFVSGSNVDVLSLSSTGAIGGPLTSATTSGSLGRFQVTVGENQLAFVEASGQFLDESNGSVSSSTLSLTAVVQVGTAATQSANINLLTHLAAPRIRELLRGGAVFSTAESQARDDVLAALTNIVAPAAATSFKSMSLFSASQGDVNSAYLVTLSALFTERAHQLAANSGAGPYDELQALLNAVADDLDDGVVDFPDTLSLIRDASYHVNPDLVTSSLSGAATSAGSSDFAGDINLFLDSDLDGELNAEDTDDDGDGVADASDAYPFDWACHLAVHGDGSSCDVESLMRANYTGRHFDIDSRGVVYMLDIDGQQVLRWSAPRQAFGMPIDIPFGGKTLAYSSVHDRIYVSFSGGQVFVIDPNDEPAITLFTTLPTAVDTIIPAGNFVIFALARDWRVVAPDGSELDQREMGNHVYGAAWDDSTESLHYTLDLADITLETIGVDQTTGLLGTPQVSPIGNEFELEGLLHLSADGSRLATGTGDIFDTATLNWQYSIPGLYRGAAWLDDGTIAGLHWIVSNDGTRLQRRDDRGDLLEYAEYPGFPQRVLNYDGRLLIFTLTENTNIHVFVPGGDIDRDGVANTSDDFPSDSAASLDTDRDGYPDNWNPGSSASDSTTGLELDPYPLDSACFLPQHGDGTTCNIGSALGFVDPFTVITDTNGVVYFWELRTQRITRWDSTNGHQNPLQFGEFSDDLLVSLKYSPEQHRLYLAYHLGRISYFDLSDPTEEIYLASTPTEVREMQPAGNYVWATGVYGQFPGRYNVTFAENGDIADLSVADNLLTEWSEWDPVRARVYLLYESGFSSTSRLWYHTVDQATGQIGAVIDSPDAPNYDGKGPIRPSPDGNKILLGSGSIYNAVDLTWSDMVTPGFADVQWDDNNSVVTIRRRPDFPVQTVLARLRLDGTLLETTAISGSPVAIRRDNGDFRVVIIGNGITFYRYTPSNDSDGDGVDNELDAFPLDPAASIDTDWDGRPDEWHPGMSELDSTTGLVLDSYPTDSACYLPEHGDGTVCDIEASIPEYIPEDIAIDDAGVVYLFSWWERRIFRWDSVRQEHLNPYVLGNDRWFGDVIPGQIAYHPTHDRLYIGYRTNEVKYIEPDAGPREQYFASTAGGVIGLASAGDYILVVDRPVSGFANLVFDSAGVLTDVSDFFNTNSPDYTWDPIRERMYFLERRTGTDVVYETIDQSTGAITGRGRAGTNFGDFEDRPPIRVSIDGNRIITGAGDIFDWQFLHWTSSFPNAFADGRWLSDGGIVTIRESNGDTVYERRDNTDTIIETANFTGAPLAILPLGTDFLIITDQGSPAFQQHTPTGS